MPQQEVDEREEDTKEEEKKEENPMIKEAKYFNNMKGSLKYKMLRWLRRVRRRMYTCTLRFTPTSLSLFSAQLLFSSLTFFFAYQFFQCS